MFTLLINVVVSLFVFCAPGVSSTYLLTLTPGGGFLRDLDVNAQTIFQNDANLWTAVTLVNPAVRIYFCYGNWLLGGYNILQAPNGYFRRIYSSLPMPHNMALFSFKFQKIDDWDAADSFRLQFDSLPVLVGWNLRSWASSYGSELCGQSGSSFLRESPLITVMVELPHSINTLTLTVYNWFDEAPTDESMGFRDITITFYTLAVPATSQTLCGIAPSPLPDRYCPCEATNYYMTPANSGSCYPCDGSCATCFSATQYSCLSCYPGYYLTNNQCRRCDSTCKTCNGGNDDDCLSCPPERYLTVRKECINTCPLPLINNANKDFTEYCTSPCSSTQYLYPDMSCDSLSSCVLPMTTQAVTSYLLICNFPCPNYQYAFRNGSCTNTCPPPLQRVLKYGRLFCNYICSTTQYLYWDGTCDTSCPVPTYTYYTEGTGVWVRNFCGYPCNSWEYLYWNGSCLSTCPSPLIAYVVHEANFCQFTCSSSTQIAFWDGSCSSTCVTATKPLILKIEGTPSRSFCYFPCEIDEFLYWNGTCSKICIPPLTSSFQNSRSFCGFPCGSNFLNWDGTCIASCGLPYSQRLEAGLKYCDYTCAPPTPYLYWNGSCLATCQTPLKITTQGSAYFCNYGCSSSNFLYFNGTCSSNCFSPLTQRIEGTPSRKFCDFGCGGSDYLYWNSSCSSECPRPLVFKAIAGKKYCDYPCSSATGAGTSLASQFLYWNSSCISTCYPPLQTVADGSVTYCVSPCESDEYLNWDGTCSSDCEIPLKPHIDFVKYCLTGCPSSQYLHWDGSCSSTCELPERGVLRSGGGSTQLFCYQPCQNTAHYYYFGAKSCRPSCPGPYYRNYTKTPYLSCISANLTEESWFASHFLVAPDVEGEVTTIRVVKLMEHMRYLDITMPPRLERLVMSKGRNILSFNFGWSMSDQMQSYFIDSNLPETFAKHGLAGSFIVNIWKDLTMMGMIIFLAVIFMVLENICIMFNLTLVRCFFGKCRGIARWNLVIVFLAMWMDDVVLYSSLQFRSLQSPAGETYDYTYIAFSLLSTTAAVVLNIGFLLGAYFFIYIMRSQSETPCDVFENQKWQDYQVLFRGYNPSSIYTQTFYLIYIVRVCFLPMLIASYLYPYPLAQTILQVVISLGILAYVVLLKPLQNKINTIQLMVSESLVLLMNICLIIMKAFEMGGIKQNSFSTILLGDFIVGGNVLFNWTWIIFTAIKLLNEARSIYKYLRVQAVKERAVWVELFIIWMQQSSMGFEEIKIRNTLERDHFENRNDWVDDDEQEEEEEEDAFEPEEEEEKETEESKEDLNVTKSFSIEQEKQNVILPERVEHKEDLEQTPKKPEKPQIDVKSLRSKNSRRHLANSQESIKIQNNLLESRVNLGIIDNELPHNNE